MLAFDDLVLLMLVCQSYPKTERKFISAWLAALRRPNENAQENSKDGNMVFPERLVMENFVGLLCVTGSMCALCAFIDVDPTGFYSVSFGFLLGPTYSTIIKCFRLVRNEEKLKWTNNIECVAILMMLKDDDDEFPVSQHSCSLYTSFLVHSLRSEFMNNKIQFDLPVCVCFFFRDNSNSIEVNWRLWPQRNQRHIDRALC